jgi:hypothetical protein
VADETLAADEHRTYPVEQIGGEYCSLCRCGWRSASLTAKADAMGELVRHRHAEHRERARRRR